MAQVARQLPTYLFVPVFLISFLCGTLVVFFVAFNITHSFAFDRGASVLPSAAIALAIATMGGRFWIKSRKSAVGALMQDEIKRSAFQTFPTVQKVSDRGPNAGTELEATPASRTVASPFVTNGIQQQLREPAAHVSTKDHLPVSHSAMVSRSDKFESGQAKFTLMLSFNEPLSLNEVAGFVKARLPFMQAIRMKDSEDTMSWSWLMYFGWLRYNGEKPYAKRIALRTISEKKYSLSFEFSERDDRARFYLLSAIVATLISFVFPIFGIIAFINIILWLSRSLFRKQLTSTPSIAADMAFRLQG